MRFMVPESESMTTMVASVVVGMADTVLEPLAPGRERERVLTSKAWA